MSKNEFKKYHIWNILFILLLIGSFPCFFIGFAIFSETSELGLVLMIFSGVMLFISIICLVLLANKQKSDQITKKVVNIRFWLVIAIISIILAIASYFIFKSLGIIAIFTSIAVFLALFTYSITIVINNRDQLKTTKKMNK